MTIFHMRRISYQTFTISMIGPLILVHWKLIQTLKKCDELPIKEIQNLISKIRSVISSSLKFDSLDLVHTDQLETNAEYFDFLEDKNELEKSLLKLADSLEKYLNLNPPYLVHNDFVVFYVFITLVSCNKLVRFFDQFCTWGAKPRQWLTYNFHLIGPKSYTFQIHSARKVMYFNILLMEELGLLASLYGEIMDDLQLEYEIPFDRFQILSSWLEILVFSCQNYDVSTWEKEDINFKIELEENLFILTQSFNDCLAETNNLLNRSDIVNLLGPMSSSNIKHIYLCTLVVHYAQLQDLISNFSSNGFPTAELTDL